MKKLILVLCLIVTPVYAATPVVLVLGDSLSAAYGIKVNEGWVHLLQEQLNQQGYAHQVINASISGDTTRNALGRLAPLLQTHKPDIVIVELGGNDGLRGLSLLAMRNNLRRIISSAQQSGAEVLLLGIDIPSNYGPAYVNKFASIYTDLADDLDASLAPSFLQNVGDNLSLMQRDGIHPTADAQNLLLKNVFPSLKPLLD